MKRIWESNWGTVHFQSLSTQWCCRCNVSVITLLKSKQRTRPQPTPLFSVPGLNHETIRKKAWNSWIQGLKLQRGRGVQVRDASPAYDGGSSACACFLESYKPHSVHILIHLEQQTFSVLSLQGALHTQHIEFPTKQS